MPLGGLAGLGYDHRDVLRPGPQLKQSQHGSQNGLVDAAPQLLAELVELVEGLTLLYPLLLAASSRQVVHIQIL